MKAVQCTILVEALCVLGMTAGLQAQTTWYVDGDGNPINGCSSWSDACPDLQIALSQAQPGDR